MKCCPCVLIIIILFKQGMMKDVLLVNTHSDSLLTTRAHVMHNYDIINFSLKITSSTQQTVTQSTRILTHS